MPMSRRSMILAAGGAGFALIGGLAGYRVTRLPDKALRPWQDAGAAITDPRLFAFSHAILAPNPHNLQPWLIRLTGLDRADIFYDRDRALPETDPFDRQITIGFGGFIEIARIAAAERGYRVEASLFPEGEPEPKLDGRPIARLIFIRDAATPKDPLFGFITKRRTSKEPYNMARPVSPTKVQEMLGLAGAQGFQHATTGQPVEEFRKLILASADLEFTTARTWMESVRLMRVGAAEIEATPHGIGIKGPMMEALILTGQISREQLADPASSAFKIGLKRYMDRLTATPAFMWQTTATNTRRDQIVAGRHWVRVNLAATQLGLSLNPVSQSLQEYPEMADYFKQAHQLAGVDTGGKISQPRVQMLARLGYGPDIQPTHRWPLRSRIVSSNPQS
jgi:hypothetical protein